MQPKMQRPAWAVTGVAIALLWTATGIAGDQPSQTTTTQRKGKVIVVRGAFTVFSLGLNDLGDKLTKLGLDVEVVPDILAGSAASRLHEQYMRDPNMGPIIFVGHSRGAELGPREARYLQSYGIPVRLIVMIDAVHRTYIPSNVQRCVNLYHTNSLGVLHGVPRGQKASEPN